MGDGAARHGLLGGGDVNLYSLFVERAQALAAPGGLVALVTPSGIAADKGAAAFFRSISSTGRLGALFDFENRKVFFPDVHASFKFCTLVFGGPALHGFATALTIGIVFGIYSSVLVASPIALVLGVRREHMIKPVKPKEEAVV